MEEDAPGLLKVYRHVIVAVPVTFGSGFMEMSIGRC
jgi:hypothetical protein